MQVPHFSSAPGGFVERIAPFIQLITYEPNERILNEGAENNKIFWLLKGSCHCTKLLPFIKRLVNSNYAGKTYQILPSKPGDVLGPDDEILREFVTIHEVEPGNNFPDMPVPRGSNPAEEVLYVNKKEYGEQLRKEDPTDMTSKADVSVIAKTKVEVAIINRVDYADYANIDMILEIINTKNIYRVPMNQLQDSYMEKRNWATYKKKLISEVTGRDKKK